MRRWPALTALLLLLFASLLTGTVVSTMLWFRAEATRSAYVLLADLDLLAEAEREAALLHPERARTAPEFGRWLRELGDPLAARLPRHRAALEALRSEALPTTSAERTRRGTMSMRTQLRELRELREDYAQSHTRDDEPMRTVQQARIARLDERIASLEAEVASYRELRFADSEVAFLHKRMTTLVERLEQFVAEDGLLAEMRRKVDWAREVERRTISDRAAAWQRAADAIATDPRFGGARLAPQIGLVPLGHDPVSGLQEFALPRAGTVPERDRDTGALHVDADSAPVLVLLPPVETTVGASRRKANERYEAQATANECPPVPRSLDWFFLGKHELTRAQWRRLGGREEPLFVDEQLGATPQLHPIANVTWWQCVDLLARHELVLPTEAQWEFAAGAGTATRYWTGQVRKSLRGAANCRDDGSDGYLLTAPIAAHAANPFGLHDVTGNVLEWCADATTGGYLECEARAGDGLMRNNASKRRSVRGGSFLRIATSCRTTARAYRNSDVRYAEVGVRIARRVR